MRHRVVTASMCLVLVTGAGACTSPGTSDPSRSPSPSPAVVASPGADRDEPWTTDIAYLVEQMQAIHPDLFHGVSPAAFHGAVDELVAAVPGLDDDEVMVGIMRLVAMISTRGGDGHMGVGRPTIRTSSTGSRSGCGSSPTGCT